MREILFKAKRIDNGEWIEGNLLLYDGIAQIHNQVQLFLISVDPDTICQYTGLNDKNGKKIWENDIVKHYNDKSKPETYDIGAISWNNNSVRFNRTSKIFEEMVGVNRDCVYEVIGNIFDNPELIS